MKSRYNWAIQGDRNTAFFHTSTLVRRKRQRIYCIKIIWESGFMMRRWLLKLSKNDSLSFFVQRKLVFLKLTSPFLDALLFCLKNPSKSLTFLSLILRSRLPCGPSNLLKLLALMVCMMGFSQNS